MTEAQWLASTNPLAMVTFLLNATVPVRTRWHGPREAKRFTLSDRKRRLLLRAVVRRIIGLLPVELRAAPLDLLDRTDSEVPNDLASLNSNFGELHGVIMAFLYAACGLHEGDLVAVMRAAGLLRGLNVQEEYACQADLVRCVLGNPFVPVSFDAAWLAANDAAAQRIAQEIHDNRGFADLPILADALEEAGCTDTAILTHCRAGGIHERGCFVVDGVLGRQ